MDVFWLLLCGGPFFGWCWVVMDKFWARSLVVSNLRSEAKGSQFESGS